MRPPGDRTDGGSDGGKPAPMRPTPVRDVMSQPPRPVASQPPPPVTSQPPPPVRTGWRQEML